MWRAHTSGSFDGKDDPEIKFLSPEQRRFTATVPRHHGWDPLEVYLRSLGTRQASTTRRPGWKCWIPDRVRSGRPILINGGFQYLETRDPKGRSCLIEFQTPAPMGLLEQMHNELFEERVTT